MVPSSGIAISSAPMSKAEIPSKPAAPPAAPVSDEGESVAFSPSFRPRPLPLPPPPPPPGSALD